MFIANHVMDQMIHVITCLMCLPIVIVVLMSVYYIGHHIAQICIGDSIAGLSQHENETNDEHIK